MRVASSLVIDGDRRGISGVPANSEYNLLAYPYYRIRKDDINEDDAIDLLHMFFDNEQYSDKLEDCIYFGHLAEVWRPVAEEPLI
jgi:hypothetical protein